ncbi:unnamed protein product [Prunus armeniaca]|uniref:Uncharacterized protein n=1 Tax=Prunus armeniaca TaxID=36596 RepID=A0A6J5UTN0_PRUAR|nr:unnamed protein product [Prunus armeniaca]
MATAGMSAIAPPCHGKILTAGSALIEELNEEGLNQEVGGQGKELNEEGLNQEAGGQGRELTEEWLTDQASKQGKEKSIMNNKENSDKGQEKANKGCSDKGKGTDKVMDDICGSLRKTKIVHQKDKEIVEGRVEGIRIESKSHSMKLRSGKRYANAADFKDFDDDSADRVKETGNEAAADWPTYIELDFEDSECKDYAKYNSDDEANKNWPEFNAATDMPLLKHNQPQLHVLMLQLLFQLQDQML